MWHVAVAGHTIRLDGQGVSGTGTPRVAPKFRPHRLNELGGETLVAIDVALGKDVADVVSGPLLRGSEREQLEPVSRDNQIAVVLLDGRPKTIRGERKHPGR